MHLSGIMGILIILTTILLADLSTTLDIKKINATFNTTVSLPCEKPCRGDVKWIKVRPVPFRTIAICKNGLCTVKEKDFENRATHILSGNISLSLQQVALGDEGWYEGYCDDKVICDITLSLLPHHKSVSVLVGDPLIINLLSSEPVRVTFRKAGLSNSTDKLICIVEEAVPLCVREYTRCSAQSHFVMFADVTQSDVGVFTVTHSKTKRIFNTVNVAVKDDLKKKGECRCWYFQGNYIRYLSAMYYSRAYHPGRCGFHPDLLLAHYCFR
ncbi:uncharacterized protein LOC121687873 isoform X2 [Alosa sapidissima]|uniref:uncharacterized protein LOC121687873 isoform X2 n=1 Tax=Alosa sapidissima TaxID=34773 RepID=UPI001C0833C4|nr:uncharacterized protein LOC121687873 isoform X2 [Alosa sapidissima]